MKRAFLLIVVVAMLGLFALPADAGVSVKTVRGKLAAQQSGSKATGRFTMTVMTSGTRGGEACKAG